MHRLVLEQQAHGGLAGQLQRSHRRVGEQRCFLLQGLYGPARPFTGGGRLDGGTGRWLVHGDGSIAGVEGLRIDLDQIRRLLYRNEDFA